MMNDYYQKSINALQLAGMSERTHYACGLRLSEALNLQVPALHTSHFVPAANDFQFLKVLSILKVQSETHAGIQRIARNKNHGLWQ